MRRCRATEHENSQALWKLLPLLGERAGVRASVSFDLIFRVGGGFWREKHFRLVTSAATALATILELTLVDGQPGKSPDHPFHLLIPMASIIGGVTKKALGSRDLFRHSCLNVFLSDSLNRPN